MTNEEGRTETRAFAKETGGSPLVAIMNMVMSSRSSSSSSREKGELVLRLSCCILAGAGFAFLISDKQLKKFPLVPGVIISKEAKYDDTQAIVVSIATLGFAAIYSLLQSVRCVLAKPTTSSSTSRIAYLWLFFLLDQITTYLLLGTSSATTEVANLAKAGENGFGWNKVCDMYTRFCNQVGMAIVCSFLTFLAMGATSVLSAYHLFSFT